MSDAALTQKQARVLDAIRDFIGKGVSPGRSDLQRQLGLAGNGAIHNHLQALKARGLIDFEYGRARSIRLIEPGSPEHQQVKPMKAYERQIQNGIGWTGERIDTLTKLWKDGVSCGRIAKQMGGLTRNAVIGKVHRLGLQFEGRAMPSKPERLARAPRPVRIDANPTPKLRPEARVFGETKVAKPPARLAIAGNGMVFETAPRAQEAALKGDAWSPLPGSSPVLLEDRLAFQCKWPVDMPGEDIPRSCGCPAPGARYCAPHTARSFQPANPRATATDLYRKYRRVA